MALNWIKASKQLPEHNQTILLEDDWGGDFVKNGKPWRDLNHFEIGE